MNWLVEDPTIVLVLAGFAAAALLFAFFRSGRAVYLLWLGIVLVLAVVVLLIDRYVVTDRERVEETLYGAVAAVQANDVEQVLTYVSPAADQLRNEIRSRMRSLEIEEAQIIDLKIELVPTEPPMATARLVGRLKFKAVGLPHDQYLIRMTVELIKEGDRWLVRSYSR